MSDPWPSPLPPPLPRRRERWWLHALLLALTFATTTWAGAYYALNLDPGRAPEQPLAAADFLREIHALSDRFVTLRIDGVDYRHRENEGRADVSTDAEINKLPATGTVTDDSFSAVVRHLATLHPSKYVPLIGGVSLTIWRDVVPFTDQNDALRFVALVDRLYDSDIPIRATGVAVDDVFPEEMLSGGFRKKYLRAQSRLVALTHRDISS
jgi:cell division protein ZapE